MKKFVLKDNDPKPKDEFQVDYDELLNPQQKEAVFHDRGAALVAAGAGTGKTRTLVYRVALLVESGVRPSNILLLTFTRRAAHEMLNRASRILDERCKNVKGGTFHFYCSQILHRYAEEIGYPDHFTIIDTADSLEVVQVVRSTLRLDKQKERFPNKKNLRSIISSAINKNLDIRVVLHEEYPQFVNQWEKIEEVADAYQAFKEKNYVMDFDDLLVKTRNLLQQDDEVRRQVAAAHRYVMVDEYQDTNALQADLTDLFSSVHKNVMVVGDDAQSIYSFRGANHRNILEFPDRFKNTKLIKLEENYRSTSRILDVANNLIAQATNKLNKKLFTRNEPGELPALVKASSENDQSRFITQMVLSLREQGMELNDIAVLFRNGRDSFDLEVELNRKNIPYIKFGGQKFTEAAHIKDILAHVRVLINPMDTLAWNRVLMIIDGIGPKTAQELFEWIRVSSTPYKLNLSDTVSDAYLAQIEELSKVLQELKNGSYTVSETVEKLVEYYKSFCKKRYDDYPKRLKDLESFIGVSLNFTSLEKMLEELALDPIEATAIETEEKTKDESPLILSTIHSAKGLEWEHVFIMQCLDGIIPSSYSVENEEKLDEELRLLYVAVTRAKKQLYFSYPVLAQSGYGEFFTQPSRFIEELNEKLLEAWMLVEEQQEKSSHELEPGKSKQLQP